MGKGSKWRKGHNHNEISENMARIKKNERANQTKAFNSHKEKVIKKDGSISFVY